ncbi:hypothetical protein GCM10011273_34850 [Asticcacaulis endophyticus]|uniref:Uncharacterized protein n=1 Tax=Asticcacaulis endophyticus TaxID=1395890 RepID=A0A918QHN3_9CAUL|nr:hypothetical protein GCM10011273_34850 [Asticcacaulis endophyticus]
MTQHHQNAGESRLERGRRALADIDGQAGENVVASLAEIAPDFATYLTSFRSEISTVAPDSICAPERLLPSQR